MNASIRPATVADADGIAAVYNQGIAERVATFETRLHAGCDFRATLADPSALPFLVAEADGRVVGWARLSPYSSRDCYAGIGEAALYVDRKTRRRGHGRRLLDSLAVAAEEGGHWKIVGLLLSTNRASLALCRAAGFREVGVFDRHGRLDGDWREVVIVERLIGEAARGPARDP